jgi:hypothetical protein
MYRIAAETLPAALYRDPSPYKTERRRIFARSWLRVRRNCPSPAHGSR